jgi:transcriptional regulator with XRE-family HTH domain
MSIIFSISQVRAACGLLDWSASDLADRIGVSKQMMSAYLGGKSGLSSQNIQKIASAFDIAGIEFTGDDGVKRKGLNTKTFRGQAGFQEFMNLVYETARDVGGEFCVSNVEEALFTKAMGKAEDDAYLARMRQVKGNFTFKILIEEGDTNSDASDYAEYRWISKEHFHSVPFYVFGNNLAFLIFGDETIVHLIQNAEIADAQRTQFHIVWESARHAA